MAIFWPADLVHEHSSLEMATTRITVVIRKWNNHSHDCGWKRKIQRNGVVGVCEIKDPRYETSSWVSYNSGRGLLRPVLE